MSNLKNNVENRIVNPDLRDQNLLKKCVQPEMTRKTSFCVDVTHLVVDGLNLLQYLHLKASIASPLM